MADTLLQDAQALENAAAAYSAANMQAKADAAQAAVSAAALSTAHVVLQSAIAMVVSDAQALDPAAGPPAPAQAVTAPV